jgi:hypothetical protein
LSAALTWIGLSLEVGIIVRALWRGFFSRYPAFFSYLVWVALADAARFYTFHHDWNSYPDVYWKTEFLSLIIGYGIILEILRLTLARYPGAARLARTLVLLIFAAIFAYVGFKGLTSPQWTPASTNAELERDLRAAQIAVLAGILAVVAYFRIPLGKNLKGVISGYGLVLATSIITLALHSYSAASFDHIWFYLQPFLYDLSLGIWAMTMWSYHPNPVRDFATELSSYPEYAAQARAALESVRTNLGKVARP